MRLSYRQLRFHSAQLVRGEHAHQRIFGQVERQKLMTEESSMRLSAAKGRLDRSLNTAEQELQEAQQQVLMLQVGIDHKTQTQSTPTDNLGLREAAEAAGARPWRHHWPRCLF